jgi:hypothetical protein
LTRVLRFGKKPAKRQNGKEKQQSRKAMNMTHVQRAKRHAIKAQNWKLMAITLSAVILIVSRAVAQRTPTHAGGGASEDHPGTHNMLVIGKETAFLSHLPMFDRLNTNKTDYTSPHRYQVILEASFSLDGKDVTDIYTRDRKSNPKTKMYTLAPTAEFVLPRLFAPDAQKPTLSSFQATVLRGHLERGGEPIDGLKDVLVTVKKVLYAQKFEPSDAKSKELQYILFGKGGEFFLAHSIVKPPDFDQILSVKITDNHFTDDELRRGVTVVFPKRKNTATQRLKENQQAQGQFHVTGAHQFHDLQVQAGTEYYFEQGELAMPAKFTATAEERKAGF